MNPYAEMLRVTNPLREPLLRQAITTLQLPAGSQGIDVGCGLGLQTVLLAEAVGREGRVTGLDASEDFLAYAQKHAKQAGWSDQVSFRQGSWCSLPFEDATFDWLWSADAAGYAAQDPLRETAELARVVKPGGTVSVLCWSSQMLLPGHPALEARLNATQAGTAPFRSGSPADQHYLRMLGWLRKAGLVNTRVETLVHTVFAPLQADIHQALLALFDMRWSGAKEEISAQDWAEYRRLCQPESSDCILHTPDYYAFFTYSLFRGTIPGD